MSDSTVFTVYIVILAAVASVSGYLIAYGVHAC